MKKGIAIALALLAALIAGFWFRGVILEPRTIEMLSASAPSEVYDLAVSADLARRVAAESIPAESGIVLTRVAFAGMDRVAAEAEISGGALASLTGKLAGIVSALLPEQVVLAAEVRVSVSEGRISVTPDVLTVHGLSVPASLLPEQLVSALTDALNAQIPPAYRPRELYCADNMCYILLAD